MTMPCNRGTRLALAACFVVAPGAAQAQAYPAKPIHMVVPYPPGGATDPLARLVGEKMGEALGQPIVVDNRGGAGGQIGTTAVAKAAPDGYTLLMGTSSTHIAPPVLNKSVSFDPVKDFTAIAGVASPVFVIAASNAVPATTFAELVQLMKGGRRVSFGASGVGAGSHLQALLLDRALGTQSLQVPYKGGGPLVQDLASGNLDLSFVAWISVKGLADAGKLRILAVSEGSRFSGAPNLPSIGEVVPAYRDIPGWIGIFAPAGLARQLTVRLNGEIVRAVNSPEVKSKLVAGGYQVIGSSPEEFGEAVKGLLAYYTRVVRDAGIDPQ